MFPTGLSIIFIFLSVLTLTAFPANAQNDVNDSPITISDQPSFASQRLCVQFCLGSPYALPYGLGCPAPAANGCFCRADLTKSASTYMRMCLNTIYSTCSGDYSTAMKVYDEYCSSVSAQVKGVTVASTTGGGAVATTSIRPGQTIEVPNTVATITVNTADNPDKKSGLSNSDVITLACALGVGVPTLLLGIWQARRKGWAGFRRHGS